VQVRETLGPIASRGDRARPAVVLNGVPRCQEPHRLVARGDAEFECRLIEIRCHRLMRVLRRRPTGPLHRLERATMEHPTPSIACFGVHDIAYLVVRKQVGCARLA